MKYISILIYSALLISNTLFGQYNETISSDRPGQAIGPHTVGAGVIQLQTGFDYTYSILNNNVTTSEQLENISTTNATQLRLGFQERVEIGIGLNGEKNETLNKQFNNSVNSTEGLSAINLSSRINLVNKPGLGVGIEYILRTNAFEKFSKNSNPSSKLIVVGGKSINDIIGITINTGLTTDGSGNQNINSFYILNVSACLGNKFSTFIESYGDFNSTTTLSVDGGFGYLLNDNMQFDISGGHQFTDTNPNYFISVGFSVRYK